MNRTAISAVAALALVLAAFGPAQAAGAIDNEFTVQMDGNCHHDGKFCRAKANSQTLTTKIDSNDAVAFEKEELLGSYALLQNTITFHDNETYEEYGNITFGTNQARDHTIFYDSRGAFGRRQYVVVGKDSYTFSLSAYIVGGTGTFEGALGFVTMTGYSVDTELDTFNQFLSLVTNVDLKKKLKKIHTAN